MTLDRSHWNGSRFRQDDSGGFYESYFQRANHPSRPLAFWIRYTAFCPREPRDDAVGELWAIFFDGETNQISAARESIPIRDCAFSPNRLDVRIGSSLLTDHSLEGRSASTAHVLEWSLDYSGHEPPLLLLPRSFYERGFPKAKVLVAAPNAVFRGELVVDGRTIAIDGWKGSQNHNWGSRHTDRYAWGQVAGFDDAPDAFLECSTAQVKIGPAWSPRLTFVVIRDEGQEFALNGVLQALRAVGRVDSFTWTLETHSPQIHVSGRIHAPASAFVGLRYPNPPGGEKICLNTKLASAEFTLQRRGQPPRKLVTAHRAAFELLTDGGDHRVAIVA